MPSLRFSIFSCSTQVRYLCWSALVSEALGLPTFSTDLLGQTLDRDPPLFFELPLCCTCRSC